MLRAKQQAGPSTRQATATSTRIRAVVGNRPRGLRRSPRPVSRARRQAVPLQQRDGGNSKRAPGPRLSVEAVGNPGQKVLVDRRAAVPVGALAVATGKEPAVQLRARNGSRCWK